MCIYYFAPIVMGSAHLTRAIYPSLNPLLGLEFYYSNLVPELGLFFFLATTLPLAATRLLATSRSPHHLSRRRPPLGGRTPTLLPGGHARAAS
jgi:hypothetical protein